MECQEGTNYKDLLSDRKFDVKFSVLSYLQLFCLTFCLQALTVYVLNLCHLNAFADLI